MVILQYITKYSGCLEGEHKQIRAGLKALFKHSLKSWTFLG